MKKKNIIALMIMMCIISIPANAQWTKVATKGASKIAEKAIKSGASKTTTKTITRGTVNKSYQSVSGNYNASRSAAAATYQYQNQYRNQQPQYVTVQCPGCSGRGWNLYNGYRYQCNNCSGRGSVMIRK